MKTARRTVLVPSILFKSSSSSKIDRIRSAKSKACTIFTSGLITPLVKHRLIELVPQRQPATTLSPTSGNREVELDRWPLIMIRSSTGANRTDRFTEGIGEKPCTDRRGRVIVEEAQVDGTAANPSGEPQWRIPLATSTWLITVEPLTPTPQPRTGSTPVSSPSRATPAMRFTSCISESGSEARSPSLRRLVSIATEREEEDERSLPEILSEGEQAPLDRREANFLPENALYF